MFIRMENFGVCKFHHCMIDGPRCSFGFCVMHCKAQHEYWLAHKMASGEPSPISVQAAERRRKYEAGEATTWPLPIVAPRQPEPEKIPELGGVTELVANPDVFIPMADTSRTSCAKTQFPVKHVK